MHYVAAILLAGSFLFATGGHAAGIYRNGVGARAMALGGAAVASPDEPLEAIGANPAGFGLAKSPTLQIGGWGAFADGEFSNRSNERSNPRSTLGLAPEMAAAYPLQSAPIAFGLGVVPESAASLDWRLIDAPGGLDGNTSYGRQRHFAEFIAVRAAGGVSVALRDWLSLGASLGVTYNRNSLVAPYTFQSHPVLSGFKTLLDLQTEGWGVNGTAGIIYRPHEKVRIGLSYRTPTSLHTTGHAEGNAGVQLENLSGPFAGARPDFRYDARVDTGLPQSFSGGVSWQMHPRTRAIFQIDWVEWSESFDQLDITLTRGNNADLNAFLGTDRIEDTAPLRWQDRLVYRAGLEFAATDAIILRAGYAYGDSPVPASTLTPMSAAILEHTLTTGLEWRCGPYSIAAAYQYDLPVTRRVATSALRSGEYSSSRTRLEAHWFGLTTGVRF